MPALRAGDSAENRILARIVGTVVATRKDAHLVAVDTVDAGVGETVLIVSGSSARMAAGLKDCPVDAAIVGIVDTVEVTAGD